MGVGTVFMGVHQIIEAYINLYRKFFVLSIVFYRMF